MKAPPQPLPTEASAPPRPRLSPSGRADSWQLTARPPVMLSVVQAGDKNMIFRFHLILTTTISQRLITGKGAGGLHTPGSPQGHIQGTRCVDTCAVCAPAMDVICLRAGVDTGSFCVHRHVYMSMCVHITRVPCVSVHRPVKGIGQGGLVLIMGMRAVLMFVEWRGHERGWIGSK